MIIKYTNIYRSKALQNLPKFGIFGWKTNHLATLIRCRCWTLRFLRKVFGQIFVVKNYSQALILHEKLFFGHFRFFKSSGLFKTFTWPCLRFVLKCRTILFSTVLMAHKSHLIRPWFSFVNKCQAKLFKKRLPWYKFRTYEFLHQCMKLLCLHFKSKVWNFAIWCKLSTLVGSVLSSANTVAVTGLYSNSDPILRSRITTLAL
jgi:hypothetical protein